MIVIALMCAVLCVAPELGGSGETGVRHKEESASRLPLAALNGRSMDAEFADLDGDGDLDLVIASEYGQNVVCLMDNGVLRYAQDALPQGRNGDSEDIAIVDVDLDGDLDLVIANEDTPENELYLNDGAGWFEDASDRLNWMGESNAVVAHDLTGDGAPDIVFGNRGRLGFLVNNGKGVFADEAASRLPALDRTVQDLELGDVDGDGDLDLLLGNEDRNALLLNDGAGVFTDASDRLAFPDFAEETREIDLGDVDGDGDLDIVVGNVAWTGASPRNRLMLNDGTGRFTDASDRLPADQEFTLDIDLADIDSDGDLDIVLANVTPGRLMALLNDGAGAFSPAVRMPEVEGPAVALIDVEVVDLTGDGIPEIYVCNNQGYDRLFVGGLLQELES